MGRVDNIPITEKKNINAACLHEEESFLTRKSAITSIFNILKKIAIYVYEKYVSNFYDDHHVEFYNQEFNFFCQKSS